MGCDKEISRKAAKTPRKNGKGKSRLDGINRMHRMGEKADLGLYPVDPVNPVKTLVRLRGEIVDIPSTLSLLLSRGDFGRDRQDVQDGRRHGPSVRTSSEETISILSMGSLFNILRNRQDYSAVLCGMDWPFIWPVLDRFLRSKPRKPMWWCWFYGGTRVVASERPNGFRTR